MELMQINYKFVYVTIHQADLSVYFINPVCSQIQLCFPFLFYSDLSLILSLHFFFALFYIYIYLSFSLQILFHFFFIRFSSDTFTCIFSRQTDCRDSVERNFHCDENKLKCKTYANHLADN